MSLRTRFALAFAAIAAAVASLVGVLSYNAAADRITDELDRTLQTATTALAAGQDGVLAVPAPIPARGPDGGDRLDQEGQLVAQTVSQDGVITRIGGRDVTLPVSDSDRGLATDARTGRSHVTETGVGAEPFRVLSTALGDGRGVLQVGLDVENIRLVLGGMAIEITWVSLAVLLLAAGAGWLLARRITARLARLTHIAEHLDLDELGELGDTSLTAPASGRDEVGRLAGSFTAMLARLSAARDAQERLVQDAAHELRTPLTSLRTNASVLRRYGELSPDARSRLVTDIQGETRELSGLVEELVELALARRGDEVAERVDLAQLARHAADRVHRRTGRTIDPDPDPDIDTDPDPVPVYGRRHGLDRAIGNLLENAAKFDSDNHDPISVHVRSDASAVVVTVTDRGPGIAETDLERVFDRFYRSTAARALPGSGLGLAIVRDVAHAHGGTVFARNRSGGGAEIGFTLDPARCSPDPEQTR